MYDTIGPDMQDTTFTLEELKKFPKVDVSMLCLFIKYNTFILLLYE